ncbi:hypothetical protein PUNSTDRAFT_132262, partial [Punctularia strigosozonata HHB-11173 SS5]|uniref:uncharacterized protein n=1 Tax=Punctularia strigosozonata (strain HHB-11173) TaxID=741275 RepID=UPI00044166E7
SAPPVVPQAAVPPIAPQASVLPVVPPESAPPVVPQAVVPSVAPPESAPPVASPSAAPPFAPPESAPPIAPQAAGPSIVSPAAAPPIAFPAAAPPVAAPAAAPPAASPEPAPPVAAPEPAPPVASTVPSPAVSLTVTPSVARRKYLGSCPAPEDGLVHLDSDDDEEGEAAAPIGVSMDDLEEEEQRELAKSAADKQPIRHDSKRNPKAAVTPDAVSSRKSNRVRRASTKLASSEGSELDTTLPIDKLVAQVEADDSLPEYFKSAVRFIGSQDYGHHPEFLRMLKAFIVFEAKAQFVVRNTRTKITNRPDIIKTWMTGQSRDFNNMKSGDPVGDIVGWFSWWATLQPKWRGATMPHSHNPPLRAKYPELKNGPLGVVTIVASLVALYCSTEMHSLRQKLAAGAQDVCWTLTIAATGIPPIIDVESENQPPRK